MFYDKEITWSCVQEAQREAEIVDNRENTHKNGRKICAVQVLQL